MKPFYLVCDPKKAKGFVNVDLAAINPKARGMRYGQNYIVIEDPRHMTDLRRNGVTVVIEGPGWPPYEIADAIAWFEWNDLIKLVPPNDPRVFNLIEEAAT